MTGAVAPETTATAPQERGWRWFVLGVIAMLAVTAAPFWPPALALVAAAVRLLLPIEQFALLALVALAACTVVGWWAGGRLSVALAVTVGTGWLLWQVPLPTTGYGAFARGWSLALGASFGLVCLATGSRPFLGRALSAVALTTVVSGAGLVGRGTDGFGGAARAGSMLEADYHRRLDGSLLAWKGRTDSSMWRAFSTRFPEVAARGDRAASTLSGFVSASGEGVPGGRLRSPLVALAPALLGLESLLALALGWATYHRLARVRIGPPLAPLRSIRFNDQLVWGLVVGAIIVMLPTLADWRMAGVNLLAFFGTLYALRGVGVLTWWIPDRAALLLLLGLAILVPLLGPIPVLATVVAITFGLGLGDTWRDFRASARARGPTSLP